MRHATVLAGRRDIDNAPVLIFEVPRDLIHVVRLAGQALGPRAVLDYQLHVGIHQEQVRRAPAGRIEPGKVEI